MTEQEQKTLYALALSRWGTESQWRMLQEECAELIAAINQMERCRVPIEDVAEELADVEIMLGQARLMVGDLVDVAKQKKLKRLGERLKQ